MGFFADRKEKRRQGTEQAAAEAALLAEAERQIWAGNFGPIDSGLMLEAGEEAYCRFGDTLYKAVREEVTSYTSGKTTSHAFGRAVVGGAFLGTTGAIAGAMGAPQRSQSVTTQVTSSEIGILDQGDLLFTNKRFIFVGRTVFSIPYDILMGVTFRDTKEYVDVRIRERHRELALLYEGMPRGLHFVIADGLTAERYYHGIREKISQNV